ncbi:FHA domain-containing protein [Streptomyces sp. NPDC059679]|uniref:FHA domain-containing protein n=1 Tax=Streptomyces sp. NPDC059679 TaxID=3346903 RepID=UPI00368C5C76
MPTCPNGHQSAADDWCEVCGHRMSGTPVPTGAVPPPPPPPMPGPPGFPGSAPGPAGPGGPGAPDGMGFPGGSPPPGAPGPQGPPGGYGYPAPAPQPPDAQGFQGPPGGYGYPAPAQQPPDPTFQAELCPQCRTPREAQAPFCEECRYNFLTQSPTSYAPPPPPGSGGFQPPQPPQPQTFPPQGPHGGPGPGGYPAGPPQPGHPSPGEPLLPSPPMQQPPGPSFSDDDWTLQPPNAAGPAAPPNAPAPPSPYGQPQPPQAPAPPGPGFGGGDYPGAPAPGPHQGPPAHFTQGSPPGPPGPAAPAGWVAFVGPDREYFMAMMHRSGPEAAGLNLPAYSPEQQLPLTGPQITIGRRRHSTGESPDIDLARPPEDPGVSHQHAVLVQQPDGGWAVVDQDSTNGTTINGGEDPIQPYVPIPLQDGDRVHVGAWTTITVRRG